MNKYTIDEILEMLDSDNEQAIQEQGLLEAKKVKTILPFCKPKEYYGSWDNCAKIIASKSDEELEEYLPYLFEWVLEMGMGARGSEIIQDRLKTFDHNSASFQYAFVDAIDNTHLPNLPVFETMFIEDKSSHELMEQFYNEKERIESTGYSFRDIDDDDIFGTHLDITVCKYEYTTDLYLWFTLNDFPKNDFCMKQYEMLLVDDNKNELLSINQRYKFPIRASQVLPKLLCSYVFEDCKYEIKNQYTLIINYVDENNNSNVIKLNLNQSDVRSRYKEIL